jgi:hypothetical protein
MYCIYSIGDFRDIFLCLNEYCHAQFEALTAVFMNGSTFWDIPTLVPETVHKVFIDFKKANDSVRREVLYSTLIEFRIPIKLVRFIKMCLKIGRAHV